jgi:hypothetical protein
MERFHPAASWRTESVNFLKEIMVEASALPFQDGRRRDILNRTNKSCLPFLLDSLEFKKATSPMLQ